MKTRNRIFEIEQPQTKKYAHGTIQASNFFKKKKILFIEGDGSEPYFIKFSSLCKEDRRELKKQFKL